MLLVRKGFPRLLCKSMSLRVSVQSSHSPMSSFSAWGFALFPLLFEIKHNSECSPPPPPSSIAWFPRSHHECFTPSSLLLRLNGPSLPVSFCCVSSCCVALLEGEGGVVASKEKGEHMGEGFSQLSTVVPCSGLPTAGHWSPSSVFVLGILKYIWEDRLRE